MGTSFPSEIIGIASAAKPLQMDNSAQPDQPSWLYATPPRAYNAPMMHAKAIIIRIICPAL
jgi:hypothetical protein